MDCAEGLALRQHCCLGLQGFLGIPEGAFAKVAPCLAVHVDCPPTFRPGSVAWEQIAAGEKPQVL